ncbi:MAG: 4-hydroxy-3-methylbut-2-enyl diphosphate reductase [Verrucomicrobia bacterium]|nr:4-hydroxy-3-methylbut-2-enyl diphosphate reductase [Verrucomicrobiota bacterium]
MNILRASHLGMCFGVRDAIALALDHPGPVTVLGDLVHNETVLDDLRSHGVRIAQQIDAVATPSVMITAHGASQRAIARVRERGLKVLEATCPLVHFAHRAVSKLVQDGFHPVIVGKRDHVEVRGITEDLAEFDVVLTEEDVARLAERPRFGVAAQTTQPIDHVRKLAALISKRFPRSEVRVVDTVCRPTKQRQTAALELSLRSEVVVVIGGANSNNTRELVAACAKYCSRVHHVQTAGDLRPEWFAAAETVGITAGTSTPDEVIDRVEMRLREFAVRPNATPAETFRTQEEHEHALAVHAH